MHNLLETIATKNYPYAYGFDYFNPVQSSVFKHKDNARNMIIAANTSAGKTIAAELLIDSTLAKNQRVIYMSPLKALTEEKASEWKTRYPDENIVIMTGDYLLDEEKARELTAGRIILMTSEMMDSRTRKFQAEKNFWLREVGPVVVDEAHILSTSRGDAVETGIMRFTSYCPEARIVLLSATMPNVDELGAWLTLLNGKKTDIIQNDWRPVRLQRHYREYRNVRKGNGRIDYWPTEYRKMKIAIDLIFSKPEEKFLVFVHSKNTGHKLSKRLQEIGLDVEFHHGDLGLKKRHQIEASFKDRDNGIRVLVSTSTTAWGVNLPARNVIILGVSRGFSHRVDELDIIQMAGRAGRYGIDQEGHVYLIVLWGEKNAWQQKFTQSRPTTSVLSDRQTLGFHILAEVYSEAVKTESDIFRWYERSLAFRQGLVRFSKDLARTVLSDLQQMKMIEAQDTGYRITRLGQISAIMYYYPYDVFAWYNNFSFIIRNCLQSDEFALAWAIASVPSSKSLFLLKGLNNLPNIWCPRLKSRNIKIDPLMTPAIEAVYHCLTATPGEAEIVSRMRAFRNDSRRIIHTLRRIDSTFTFWHHHFLWDYLDNIFHPEIQNSKGSSPGINNNAGEIRMNREKMKEAALDHLFNLGYLTGPRDERNKVPLEDCPQCGSTAVVKGTREIEVHAGTAYDYDILRFCYRCRWRAQDWDSYVDDFSDIDGPYLHEDEQERLTDIYGEGGFEAENGFFIPESYDPS